jgi:hypothetical protein
VSNIRFMLVEEPMADESACCEEKKDENLGKW